MAGKITRKTPAKQAKRSGPESALKKRARTQRIVALLRENDPDAVCALWHENPLQLLIATILSAQCTDERVNTVTPVLFERYPQAKDLAAADLEDIEQIIRPTGFFRNKAKSIKGAATVLAEKYNGVVPQTLEELVELPGVGRKTANVVLGVAYEIASGVVVDTHVTRLSNRLGLVEGENAVQIEQKLILLLPKEDWIAFSHLLITHGRQVCKAIRPRCEICFLNKLCPSAFKVQPKPRVPKATRRKAR
jgi:endonuclease-3